MNMRKIILIILLLIILAGCRSASYEFNNGNVLYNNSVIGTVDELYDYAECESTEMICKSWFGVHASLSEEERIFQYEDYICEKIIVDIEPTAAEYEQGKVDHDYYNSYLLTDYDGYVLLITLDSEDYDSDALVEYIDNYCKNLLM